MVNGKDTRNDGNKSRGTREGYGKLRVCSLKLCMAQFLIGKVLLLNVPTAGSIHIISACGEWFSQ